MQDPEWKKGKKPSANPVTDLEFVDSPLSKLGEKQCRVASKLAGKLIPNLRILLVSPLKRTLQTAYLIFKNHPNFQNIKVILVPDLRDKLHSPCDIPGPIEEIIGEFDKLFPNFDYSLINMEDPDRHLWFL